MEDAMTSSTHPKTLNGLQGDLLSGEWLSGAPKRGSGQHIRLKQNPQVKPELLELERADEKPATGTPETKPAPWSPDTS